MLSYDLGSYEQCDPVFSAGHPAAPDFPTCVPPQAAAAARGQARPAPVSADGSAGFADFSQFPEPAAELSRARQGAFEVYKKPGQAQGGLAGGQRVGTGVITAALVCGEVTGNTR